MTFLHDVFHNDPQDRFQLYIHVVYTGTPEVQIYVTNNLIKRAQRRSRARGGADPTGPEDYKFAVPSVDAANTNAINSLFRQSMLPTLTLQKQKRIQVLKYISLDSTCSRYSTVSSLLIQN